MLNFKSMESIRLNEISGQEFGSFFKKLKWSQRSVFVREHRSEIEATSNADVLQCLCEFGYFSALYPLVAIDSNRANSFIIDYYTPQAKRWKTYPSRDDERKILVHVAKELELVRFLRENTNRLWDFSSKVPFISLIYENATQEVLDYLISWHSKNFVPISSNQAYAMFALASPCVIQKYLTKIGSLNGNHGFVTYGHLKNLAVRTDIDVEEKHELLLLTVNRLKVRTQTIHDLRVAGLLDF